GDARGASVADALTVRRAGAWVIQKELPAWLAALAGDPGWLDCLEQVVAGVPAEVRPTLVLVELHVQAGRVASLRLGRGLPTPACLRAHLPAEAPLPTRAGWVRLEFKLP
ncbi:MAG TPA: hypothetical protein P5076_23905, partial [Myxococcota bacterium]|nr:hypothetical protein [Myxococcota bacterium]